MSAKSLVVVVEEEIELSPEELAQAANVTPEFIQELFEYGIIEYSPSKNFDAIQLRRVRTVYHLQQDLEVNLAGAALVLELMEKMDEMEKQLQLFRKHMGGE